MAFALARSNYCGAGDSDEKAVTCRLAEWDDIYSELLYAREQGGLMMHHDAITGTAKDYVVDDYEERMRTAMQHSSQALGDMFELLLYGEAIPDNRSASALEGLAHTSRTHTIAHHHKPHTLHSLHFSLNVSHSYSLSRTLSLTPTITSLPR